MVTERHNYTQDYLKIKCIQDLIRHVQDTTYIYTYRYKTTVSSAREKVFIRLCAQKRTYSHINNGE